MCSRTPVASSFQSNRCPRFPYIPTLSTHAMLTLSSSQSERVSLHVKTFTNPSSGCWENLGCLINYKQTMTMTKYSTFFKPDSNTRNVGDGEMPFPCALLRMKPTQKTLLSTFPFSLQIWNPTFVSIPDIMEILSPKQSKWIFFGTLSVMFGVCSMVSD